MPGDVTLAQVDDQVAKIEGVVGRARAGLPAIIATFERTLGLTAAPGRTHVDETQARFRAALDTDLALIGKKLDLASACVQRAKAQRARAHGPATAIAAEDLVETVREATEAAIAGSEDVDRLRASVQS